jgi:hypothetical protein
MIGPKPKMCIEPYIKKTLSSIIFRQKSTRFSIFLAHQFKHPVNIPKVHLHHSLYALFAYITSDIAREPEFWVFPLEKR